MLLTCCFLKNICGRYVVPHRQNLKIMFKLIDKIANFCRLERCKGKYFFIDQISFQFMFEKKNASHITKQLYNHKYLFVCSLTKPSSPFILHFETLKLFSLFIENFPCAVNLEASKNRGSV